MPKVSVIMNCYNGERYLQEAIDSVYAQTFKDWEIIFWDNASTDSTPVIVQSYDRKLRYFRSDTTTPLGDARRQAVEKAHGEWIAFLDCDDVWFPNKLQRQMAVLENSDHIFCYAGIRDIRPDGSMIREIVPKYATGWQLEQQLQQFDINMVTPLIRRSALKEYGLNFDKHITASEEYNLFIRLAAKGTFCTVAEVLGAWRICPHSLTDRQISKWGEERHYTLEQLKQENPGIETKYPKAFKEAHARGDYYHARYLVSIDRSREARKVMRSIATVDIRYLMLWLGMYVPFVWGLLHRPIQKRLLTLFFGMVKAK